MTGTLLSQRRYLPYGETRWSNGPFPTDRRFTGQREEVTLGVYDYGARFYSPGLGRFLSADTLVPEAGRPQSLNRYMYVLGNPLRYTDPSGYFTKDEIEQHLREQGMSDDEISALIYLWTHDERHTDWWQLLLEAQVGDKLDGLEARNANSPWNGKSVTGFFKAGSGGRAFDFVGVLSDEVTFSVADFYSDNPLDGNAHIRTDIILARAGNRLGANTDQYIFHKGTDLFANGIPDLPEPDSRMKTLGWAFMGLGFVGMAKGTIMMVAGFAGAGPTAGATLAAVVPGIGEYALGAASFAEGAVLVVDYNVACKRIEYTQDRLQPYTP